MKRVIMSGAALVALFFISASVTAESVPCGITDGKSFATEQDAIAACTLDQSDTAASGCTYHPALGTDVTACTSGTDKFYFQTGDGSSGTLRNYFHNYYFPPPPSQCESGQERYARFDADIDTMSQYMSSGQKYVDEYGCEFEVVSGITTCAIDELGEYCALRVVSNGVDNSSAETPLSVTMGTSTPIETATTLDHTDYEQMTTTEYGSPEDGCTPGTVAETCISTQTDYDVTNLPGSLKWDPVSGTVTLSDGGSETVATISQTTTVTDNVTGEQTVTTTTTTNHYDSGSTTTIIGSTGATSTSGQPTSSTSTTTSTTTLDGSGNVTGSAEITTANETPENEEQLIKKIGETKGDWTEYDETVNSWSDHSPIENTIQSNKLNSSYIIDHFSGAGAACSASQFQLTFMGISMSMDVCPFIEAARKLLYWAFAMFTMIYIYKTWLQAFGGKK